jgi:hypothetical protein
VRFRISGGHSIYLLANVLSRKAYSRISRIGQSPTLSFRFVFIVAFLKPMCGLSEENLICRIV